VFDAGHAPTPEEKGLTSKFFFDARRFLRSNLIDQNYLNFLKEPELMYDVDPGEETLIGKPEEDKASSYMQK